MYYFNKYLKKIKEKLNLFFYIKCKKKKIKEENVQKNSSFNNTVNIEKINDDKNSNIEKTLKFKNIEKYMKEKPESFFDESYDYFSMKIEKVDPYENNTIVSGTILNGFIKLNKDVVIRKITGEDIYTTVIGIAKNGCMCDSAKENENAILLLKDINSSQIDIGDFVDCTIC